MRLIAGVLVLAACHGAPPAAPPTQVAAGPGVPDELTVHLGDLRSDAGTIRCYLYDDGDGFPDSQAHIVSRATARPANRAGTCAFHGIARARDYAIVIHHDENDDTVFQKNALGMPQEGYGFSNDVHPRFSAPSFADCKFHYDAGAVALRIAMQY